ncbi:MAG: 7-cyano-7-deazaguanine synthase, partial [Candidatus Micrarchaeaceae archaeon]
IKDALENIIGGWSFIMIDQNIDKVYISTSFVPLAELYIPEIGYIVHSDIDTLKEVNKKYGNTLKSKLNEIEPYTITELGLFNLNDYHRYDYKHKFDHPIWSPDSTNKRLYIVLASSGLDSTALLTYLKYKNENVMPLYIDYASRVNDAERIAVEKICNKLGMELATIDLSPVFNKAKASSVLLDSSLDMNMVDLANDWVPNRNEMFISAASTLAESLILTNKYNNIIITGGVPTLGDQNEYSDCSQKFINSMNKTIRLSTLPGAYRYIKYKNPLRYLKKTEMVILINNINPDILDLIVSCNRPKVIDGEVYQCAKNGIPACYPGFENYIAYFKAGVTDKRKYYEVESDSDDEITKDITNFDNYTIEKIPSLLEILSKVK